MSTLLNNSHPPMNGRPIDSVLNRRSNSQFLDESVPPSDLQLILQAASAANDHGHLRPWELHVYQGTSRDVLREAFIHHSTLGERDQRKIDKAAVDPYRAPAVVCVSTRRYTGKIPLRDQTFSAVAACQLITLAAHLLGYAAIWKTGAWATSSVVREDLGIPAAEEIVGFIHLGMSAARYDPRVLSTDRIFHHA